MNESTWVNELKSQLDIVNVIGSYVNIVKRGKNYFCCCPFHNEKTPSFCISGESQTFYCFGGCGKKGDVINFVMEYENLSFMEACQLLARRVGFRIPENVVNNYSNEEHNKKDRLYKLMETATLRYSANLYSTVGKVALDYLYGRGIDDEIIKTFRLGYSISGSDLVHHLLNAGYSMAEMSSVGILSERDGKGYDTMYGRVIYPIINHYNQVIAFGGRALDKLDVAKYKNTTNGSELFEKSSVLYGINNIKKLKQDRELNDAIIVEGYMDVIGLHKYGIKNAVASMGTSLTEKQAALLSRYTNNVLICYDGDVAGQTATDRGMLVLYNKGLNVRVMTMPDGLDPDEYVAKFGESGFRHVRDIALPLFEYRIRTLANKFDMKSYEGRGRFAAQALADLKVIGSEVTAQPYLELISKLSKIELASIQGQYGKEIDVAKLTKSPETNITADKYHKSLYFVLYCMLKDYPFAQFDVELERYIDEEYVAIFKKAIELHGKSGSSVTDYHGLVDDGEFFKIFTANEVAMQADADTAAYYEDCMYNLKKTKLEAILARLSASIRECTDAEEKSKLIRELSDTQKTLRLIRH